MSYDTDNNGIPIAEPAMPPMQWITTQEPLTKRERFAMAAMQGFCANSDYAGMKYEALASMARKQADAAIAELEAHPHP